MLCRQTILLFLLVLACACVVPVLAQRPTGDCNYRDGRGWVPCENGPPSAYTPPPPDPAVLEAQRKAREAGESNDKGLAALARADWAAAERYFEHALQLAPNNSEYRYNLAEAKRKLREIADKNQQERERQEKLERDKQELLPKIKSVSSDGVSGAGSGELKFKTVTAENHSKPLHQQPRIGAAGNVSGDVSVIRDGKPVKVGPGFAMNADDHVVLGADGHLQVLLLDETVFTLGPNSDMILDDFVYDPATNTTKVIARFTKGVFRFVTGTLSRHESPDSRIYLRNAVAVGIRGTDFDIHMDDAGNGTITLHSGAIDLRDGSTGKVTTMKPGETVSFSDLGIVVPPPKVVPQAPSRRRPTVH